MGATGADGAGTGSAAGQYPLLVVGVDGSETSWRALHYAFGAARRQNAALVAVFAHTPITSATGIPVSTWDAANELAAELSAAVATLASEHAVTAEFVHAQRDPVCALTRIATERHADAIIIGASTSLAHKLFGSKATRTIRRSRCPVIVVP